MPITVEFNGQLYPEQEQAIVELARHRCGTLYATTAFGKTVTAAAMIARKEVNTLILVHTKALLDQWRERLSEYLITDFQPEEQPKGRGGVRNFNNSEHYHLLRTLSMAKLTSLYYNRALMTMR